jgi:hypothetical protein
VEDEADFAVADLGQLIVAEARHRVPVEPVLARGGGVEAAETVGR